MGTINNIVCPECFNSWDQDGKYDTICKNCGEDCSDQAMTDSYGYPVDPEQPDDDYTAPGFNISSIDDDY